MHIKLYDIYNKVKDVFVKPKLHFKFGLWKNDPNLPVWRRGPTIVLCKNWMYVKKAIATVMIKTGENCYSSSYHNLPRGLRPYDLIWKSDVRRKLRKFGLGWLRPTYTLPIFFAFGIYNLPLGWKTKWGDYRYEWPPQFTIVFFGLSMSWWLTAPTDKGVADEDDYWESILNYINYKDLSVVNKTMGKWQHQDNTTSYRLKSEFLKEPYRSQILEIQK